jgi:hypothetical protein
MNNPTVDYLKQIMPGQPDAWYQRIADDIAAGKMPLPTVEGVPVPELLTAPPQPTINAARQRFLNSQPHHRSPSTPDTVGEALHQASRKPKRPAQPAKAATKRELERLIHSDRLAAERLAAQVAFANPGQSEQWCWEKAIFDLERDRH